MTIVEYLKIGGKRYVKIDGVLCHCASCSRHEGPCLTVLVLGKAIEVKNSGNH